ncbi:hypothetical protein SBOR_5803 [Sclerotinia borealis F-4128]|uniref:Uncharacterized protein n=1 Tax=Sclerotinia borealis (strain F-4128) TaxID=1432307 RepID=W9CDB1_SCLBF|nr:hypothetical protein SBOR_5803 [Sclerotinia borealis F-4128]
MQNSYMPMLEPDHQDGWPFKVRQISRRFIGHQISEKAPPRLHERPMLVQTPELDLLEILSSTVNTTPAASINVRPAYQRQTTLEDPRRFNVLDTKANQESSVFKSLKRRIPDRYRTRRPDSSLATRATPTSLGFGRDGRTSMDLDANDLPGVYMARPATPKFMSKTRESSPVRAARSIRTKVSRKFSRKGKGYKLASDADAAYPPDLKIISPDPVANHPACIYDATTSAFPCNPEHSSSTRPKSLRRLFSRKDLCRPTTSTSTSTSNSRPPLPSMNSITVRKMFSSSSIRQNGNIVTDLPVMEAEEIQSPPPAYSASMDFATKAKLEVDLLEHPALAGSSAGYNTSNSRYESQLQSQISNLLESTIVTTATAPTQSHSHNSSNAPRPSMAQTVRYPLDLYISNTITTYPTHDTVAPLLIRKAARGPSPTPFTTLTRSLSDFASKSRSQSSRPTPAPRCQSQDTGTQHLFPKPPRPTSTNRRSKSYYTLGSAESAVPGISRSTTVSNARRNSRISATTFSANANVHVHSNAYARNSTSTIRNVPREMGFLPIKAAPAPGALRNFSRPGTARTQTQTEGDVLDGVHDEVRNEVYNGAKKNMQMQRNAQMPRRAAKPDFLKLFDVPNLMMDCVGGYDDYGYGDGYGGGYGNGEYTYSTGKMIREVIGGGAGVGGGGSGLGLNSEGAQGGDSDRVEFMKFIADAREARAREEVPRVVGSGNGRGRGSGSGRWGGREGVVGINMHMGMGSLRMRDSVARV